MSVGLYVQAGHGVSKTADTSLGYHFDWLRSCDSLGDVNDPEVPNQRLLPCSVCTTYTHQFITACIIFNIRHPLYSSQPNQRRSMTKDEQLQTAAQNPCDALTMTKTLLVGYRKSGCKRKNDGMQMSYFAINYAIYILA